MTLAISALALYHRTKAQFRQLTRPTPLLAADHNHLQHPVTIAFPTHRTPGRRHRRSHPLTTAIRRLLAAYPPAPLPPRLAPLAQRPPCRLCDAMTRTPATRSSDTTASGVRLSRP